MKTKNNEKVIAVIGATGQQGGAVVRALQASSQFKVRALSRNPGNHHDPDQAGNGEYLPLVGDFMSFNEIVETLNLHGHNFSFTQVPADVFATFFPGAAEIAAMFRYVEGHTYLGSESRDRIALANKIAGRQPTKFSTWARLNVPVQKL